MIQINQDRCIGCGKCAADCVEGIIAVKDGKAFVERDCIQCGHCVAICPVRTIMLPEYGMEDVTEPHKDTPVLNPQVFLQAIKMRRSIRSYRQQPVEADKLQMLIQAGRYTATAKNNQGTRFVIVQKELEKLKDIVWGNIDHMVKSLGRDIPREMLVYAAFLKRRKENPQDDYLFRNAPAVMFITSDWMLDAGLAAQNIEMMAVAQGLGVLYNGYLGMVADQDTELKEWLQIEDTSIRACLLLGYPAVKYQRSAPRKEASVIWR